MTTLSLHREMVEALRTAAAGRCGDIEAGSIDIARKMGKVCTCLVGGIVALVIADQLSLTRTALAHAAGAAAQ